MQPGGNSMVWINSYSFDVLAHGVSYRLSSFKQWDVVRSWCEDNVGDCGTHWVDSHEPMQLPRMWWFATVDAATAFALTWCGHE
jgi:hypothetical protein